MLKQNNIEFQNLALQTVLNMLCQTRLPCSFCVNSNNISDKHQRAVACCRRYLIPSSEWEQILHVLLWQNSREAQLIGKRVLLWLAVLELQPVVDRSHAFRPVTAEPHTGNKWLIGMCCPRPAGKLGKEDRFSSSPVTWLPSTRPHLQKISASSSCTAD